MGIYIPGIEMPIAGMSIEIAENVDGKVYARLGYGLDDWHEVISVPEHGRLVDVSVLEVVAYTGTEGRPDTFDAGVEWAAEQIDKLPTVIPEEERKVSYQRKCKYFSMEYVGNPGKVPACNRGAILEAFDCSNCADNPDNKKPTNADRIRAMSDEELADFLHELKNFDCPENGARPCVEKCGDCWLTWLREDVKEE